MPIDMKTEELITLADATHVLPRLNGRRLHSSTIWRWAVKGVGSVKLDYLKIGGRIVTSREALNRFSSALADSDRRPGESQKAHRPEGKHSTDGQRAKAIAQAEVDLEAAGIS